MISIMSEVYSEPKNERATIHLLKYPRTSCCDNAQSSALARLLILRVVLLILKYHYTVEVRSIRINDSSDSCSCRLLD